MTAFVVWVCLIRYVFFNISALNMDSQNDDSTSTLEQAIVGNDGVTDLEEICPKHFCISISEHTSSGTTPVTVATKCSKLTEESTNNASKLSTDCQDISSETPLTSSEVSDNGVTQSELSSSKAYCNEDHVESNDSFTTNITNTTSDTDGCRRRNLRRKLSNIHKSLIKL